MRKSSHVTLPFDCATLQNFRIWQRCVLPQGSITMAAAVNKLRSLIDRFRKWLKCNKQDVPLWSAQDTEIFMSINPQYGFFTLNTFIICPM